MWNNTKSRRRTWVGIGFFALIVLLIGWSSLFGLRRNHVKFLLNQKQFPAALKELHDLQARRPDDGELLALRVKTLVLLGLYNEAVQIAPATHRTTALAGDGDYWLAIALFQHGDQSVSQNIAERSLTSRRRLHGASSQLAAALADPHVILEMPDENALAFKLLFPVEQATYYALAAARQAEQDRAEVAARLLHKAFARGNRNPESMRLGVMVASQAGDYGAAETYLHFIPEEQKPAIWKDMLNSRNTGAGRPRLQLSSGPAPGKIGPVQRARAIAWASVHSLGDPAQSSATLNRLRTEYSDDPVLEFFNAEKLWQQGNKPAARAAWQKVWNDQQSLQLLLRIKQTAKSSSADTLQPHSEIWKFIESTDPMQIHRFPAGSQPSGDRKDYVAISVHQPASLTTDIPQRGNYKFTILAANRKTSAPMLLRLDVDQQPVAAFLVESSADYALYQAQQELDAGQHDLDLYAVSDKAPAAGNLEIYQQLSQAHFPEVPAGEIDGELSVSAVLIDSGDD